MVGFSGAETVLIYGMAGVGFLVTRARKKYKKTA